MLSLEKNLSSHSGAIASYNPGRKSGRQSAKATCDTSFKMGSHYSSFLTPTPSPKVMLEKWLYFGWLGLGKQRQTGRLFVGKSAKCLKTFD